MPFFKLYSTFFTIVRMTQIRLAISHSKATREVGSCDPGFRKLVRRTEPESREALRLGGNESRKARTNGSKTCTGQLLYSKL